MVPGSTLMYGSSFCMVTRSPRAFIRRPSDAAVRPLPSDEATPPVTKMCFAKVLDPLWAHRGGRVLSPGHPAICWALRDASVARKAEALWRLREPPGTGG